MARPIKKGLDYFPLDTDIIHDIKIRKILRSNGPQSIAILVDLLGNIYGDEGYYMTWDDDVRFLVADDIGISEASVGEMVKRAIQVNFFDEGMFDKYSILTSIGIQKRYQNASYKKVDNSIDSKYSLIVSDDNNRVSDDGNPTQPELPTTETPVSDDRNPQSKGKKSKANKTKEEKTTRKTSPSPREKVLTFYQQNLGQPAPVVMQELDDWLEDHSPEWVIAALTIAAESHRQFPTARTVMRRWQKENIKTLDDIKADQVSWENRKTRGNQRKPPISVAPNSSFSDDDIPF